MQVQQQELLVPVYLLPVAGADLILGSTWLATLGPQVADYSQSVLKCFQQGIFIILQVDKEAKPSQAQFHQLRRLQNTDAISECYTVQQLSARAVTDDLLELPDNMDPDLAILLHTYRGVFSTLTSLPPKRTHNHAITLQEGSKPVKVRPYRYPHSQKEQIDYTYSNVSSEGCEFVAFARPYSNRFV